MPWKGIIPLFNGQRAVSSRERSRRAEGQGRRTRRGGCLSVHSGDPCSLCHRVTPSPCHHSGPTGASLLFTDANGAEAGHILYDPYGGILTSTLSAALTTALAEEGATADPATGLVYQGNGRFYNPYRHIVS